RVALKQGMGPDDEILDAAFAAAAARAVAPLHLAGTQGRLLLDHAVADAHLLERLHGLVAVAQRAADLGDDGVADDDRPARQRIAQRGLGGVGMLGIGEQLDDHGGVDGDHLVSEWPRATRTASSADSKPSSLNLPRAREIASS